MHFLFHRNRHTCTEGYGIMPIHRIRHTGGYGIMLSIVLDIRRGIVHCYFIIQDMQTLLFYRESLFYCVKHTEGYRKLLFHRLEILKGTVHCYFIE